MMKIEIAKGYEQYRDFIEEVPERFANGEGSVIYDGRNSIHLLECEGHEFVVKRFHRVNAVQRIAYTLFRPTKARRAFLYAGIFRSRGIDTPHEIAYIEESPCGFFKTGYFICEKCDSPDAFKALVPIPDFDKDLASGLAKFIANLHEKGIIHGDLNFGNFLYKKTSDGYHFTVIDINRSRFFPTTPPKEECLKNLRTMTHRRDLYRFMVREYAAKRGWDADATEREAVRLLDQFEQHSERKARLKRQIKRL